MSKENHKQVGVESTKLLSSEEDQWYVKERELKGNLDHWKRVLEDTQKKLRSM